MYLLIKNRLKIRIFFADNLVLFQTLIQFILLNFGSCVSMNKQTDKLHQTRYVQSLQHDGYENKHLYKQKQGNYQSTNRQQIVDAKIYGNIELQRKHDVNFKIPSPRGIFQRSSSRQGSFRERNTVRTNDNDRYTSPNVTKQPPVKADYALKLTQLKKKLTFEIQQKQKLKEAVSQSQLKISALNQQLAKLKQQLKWSQQQLEKSNANQQQKEKELTKARQTIQSLNKALNSSKNNKKQTKLNDNKAQVTNQKMQKLMAQNVELAKKISQLKLQYSGKKPQITQQDKQISRQTVFSLHLQVNRLKKQLQKDKSERQKLLESIIIQLQSKLYEKEKDLRKTSVHINLMGRKHTISIDQVRQKKDQQIKYLRQKFIKVSKDLKQTKNKIDKNDKKKMQDRDPSLRKFKSRREAKFGSDTDDFTFELSSQV